MTIGAILGTKGTELVSVCPEVTVGEAVKLLDARGIGAMPVIDGDQVVGVFSERDVIRVLAGQGASALGKPVTEAMTAPAITTDPTAPVLGALSQMTRLRVRHLPVVQEGALIGIVSIGDLVKYRIDHVETEATAMRDYIQSA